MTSSIVREPWQLERQATLARHFREVMATFKDEKVIETMPHPNRKTGETHERNQPAPIRDDAAGA